MNGRPFPPESYINRDTSWLEFNRRVLQEAQDERHPLIERAKFLAIFATNLDEFFMVRVSGLREQIAQGVMDTPPDGHHAAETFELIANTLRPMLHEQAVAWRDAIRPMLRQHGVCVFDYDELDAGQRERIQAWFKREVFPVVTPLAFDPGHPFPHISNLSLSLAVVIGDGRGRQRFARVKVPPSLPRLVPLDADGAGTEDNCQTRFVWLDQIIAANIGALFPGMNVERCYAFRVTRDTDIEIQEDEADDLLATIEQVVHKRRFGSPVRLEIAADMPDIIRDILTSNLRLNPSDVYRVEGPLNLADLMELMKLPLPRLKDQPYSPRLPVGCPDSSHDPDDWFSWIRAGDRLLHHPYETFAPVVDFIAAAAKDPNVLAIKSTLYRVGSNSPVVRALMEAARNGKQVAAMVELKARFDEENNIQWARALELVGAHVVYGLPGMKVHAKMTLVVRREADGIRRYLHLGTGNYNAGTARIYTDYGLLTCRDDFCEDVSELFNFLTGYSKQTEYRQLLVAPVNLRRAILQRIERETRLHQERGGGRLLFKMNALVDPEMIEALYRASQAGVKVDLLIRGISCLRPGVAGLSENVRVVSVVGRHLEHARAYWFANAGAPELFLGSADLMQRNLDRRVETVFPILDRELRARLENALELQLRDNAKARELLPDGSYRYAAGNGRVVDSQAEFMRAGDR
ncbi:MAG: polyphosphate kinase 1 [Thermoflexales bacterium]|nr:polyphosphate kinase 1 [Thermoflexales bacterium]